jgi:xanthosine utilization system XapX-like protein
MDTTKLMNLGIAAGIVYAAYRFAPNASVKAMALGVAGVIVGRQIPYVKDYV